MIHQIQQEDADCKEIEYITDSGDRITDIEAEIYIAANNYKNNNKGLRKSSALYQKDAFIHGAKWMLNYLKNKHNVDIDNLY